MVAPQPLPWWLCGPCWGPVALSGVAPWSLLGGSCSTWHPQSSNPPHVPAGPVGFQSNNVPLEAGMFTSIGMSQHPDWQPSSLGQPQA